MPTLHLLVGIQGSGKSTFSRVLKKYYNYEIVSSDEVRKGYPHLEESSVFPFVYKMVANLLKKGKDVIFDATNITEKVRKRNVDAIRNIYSDFEVVIYYLNTSLETCLKRVEIRNQMEGEFFIPLNVIRSFDINLIPPTMEEVKRNNYKDLIVIDEKKEG